ncbi:MAG: SMP-30/gluconolactonase/LRE family protein [Thermoanaerobaculia bacterium]
MPTAAEGSAASRIERLEKMLSTSPGHGGLMYELAAAEAGSGRHADAIRWLEKAVSLGYDFDLAGDARFATSKKFEPFRELAGRLASRPPARTSTLAFRIAERDLIPEGIAWDPSGKSFYVGSLYKKKILRLAPDGAASDFVPSGRDGLWTVLGLRVDPARRILWAAFAADGREGPAAGSSGLFAFDLVTGRLLGKHVLDGRSGKHLFNDLAVTGAGEVFLTDSEAGAIYRLAPGGESIEAFLPGRSFTYPNGIALDVSGSRLDAADFSKGISIVEIATKKTRPLPHPRAVTLHSADRLYAYGASLVAIQNGPGMERVVHLPLDPAGERVVGERVIEGRNPELEAPTTGAIAGSDFFYIANSQLDALGEEDGKLRPEARLEEVRIFRAPLLMTDWLGHCFLRKHTGNPETTESVTEFDWCLNQAESMIKARQGSPRRGLPGDAAPLFCTR